MSILWLIIKIILMILLVVLGLILIIVGTILFAPIRYEAYYAKYESLSYDIKITYLVGIKGLFYLDEEKKNHKVSLFGSVLYKNEEEKVEDSSEEERNKSNSHNRVKTVKNNTNTQKAMKPKHILDKSIIPREHVAEEKRKITSQLKREVKRSVAEVSDNITEETVGTVEKMHYSWAKKLVLDKRTYSAVKQICKCVWRIIRTVLPYEWDFELVIGEEEPADTGELIAKLTMLYPLYYQHGIIRGDYEKACFEGGFLVKGKFTIGCILGHIICCLLNHSVRQFIKLIMELRKEEQHGK